MIQQPRPVQFQTIIEAIKKRSIFLTMGAIFSLIPIPIVLIFSLVFSLLRDDVPEVDYTKINERGKAATATITNIETQYNITINNQHPSIISYKYYVNGNSIDSKFKTLAPDVVNRLHIGDTIPIKHFNGQSIISSLDSFEFPYGLFMTVPFIFFLIGFPFLLYLIYTSRAEIRLYKYGKTTEAEVVAITHKSGLPISRKGQGVHVHYQYTMGHNRTYLDKSFTSDLSLLNTLKQGDLIKIFVSPEDESKSTLVPRLESVRNNWQI